jgi:hypothetical protein
MPHRAFLTPERLDLLADQAQRAHAAFQGRLRIALASAILERLPMARTLQDETGQAWLDYWQGLVPTFFDHTGEAYRAGAAAAGMKLSDKAELEIQALNVDAAQSALDEINIASVRDRLLVQKAFRRHYLEEQLTRGNNGGAQRRINSLQMKVLDAAGRRWDSALWVRSIVRHHLVTTQVETALFCWVKNGLDRAVAVWGDDHEGASYLEIKDQIFHPNSTASVVRP